MDAPRREILPTREGEVVTHSTTVSGPGLGPPGGPSAAAPEPEGTAPDGAPRFRAAVIEAAVAGAIIGLLAALRLLPLRSAWIIPPLFVMAGALHLVVEWKNSRNVLRFEPKARSASPWAEAHRLSTPRLLFGLGLFYSTGWGPILIPALIPQTLRDARRRPAGGPLSRTAPALLFIAGAQTGIGWGYIPSFLPAEVTHIIAGVSALVLWASAEAGAGIIRTLEQRSRLWTRERELTETIISSTPSRFLLIDPREGILRHWNWEGGADWDALASPGIDEGESDKKKGIEAVGTLFDAHDRVRILDDIQRIARGEEESIQREVRLRAGRSADDEEGETVRIRMREIRFGDRPAVLMALDDISELRTLKRELAGRSLRDELTGLGNRTLFEDRLAHALTRGLRSNDALAVLMVDLDDFKTVNDSLGHKTGDALLKAAAERIVQSLRASDTATRFGADQFALLLEDTDEIGTAVVAERILNRIRRPFTVGERTLYISASIGIATNAHARSVDELIRNADTAMYGAKRQGKATYLVFAPEMHRSAVYKLELGGDLQEAVEREEFILHYQPTIDLKTGRLVGAEALIRWIHPDRGMVPPLEFISLAEETGLINPIGRWVLETACRQAKAWQDDFPNATPFTISVNLSPRQLLQPDLVSEVEQILCQTGLDPACLVLEITENALMTDSDVTFGKLRLLKELGVGIALDDFGTGHAWLSYFQKFPIDILKIDKSFVDRASSGQDASNLMNAILTLADMLKLRTVAEGIEVLEQLDFLKSLGCTLGQGYYFARPMEPLKLAQLLSESHRSLPHPFSTSPSGKVDEHSFVH